jgi:hypothetical protein
MARSNYSAWRRTHEGAPVAAITVSDELRRSVLSCLLWEDTFYESGEDIAARIYRLAHEAPMGEVAALAIEARERFHLRHAPLLLLVALVDRNKTVADCQDPAAKSLTRDTIARVIQRADEAAELLAIYWRLNPHARSNDKTKRIQCVPASIRRGLARAVPKFDEYQLAKYDREEVIKVRDVLRIARPKPKGDDKRTLWGKAVARELAIPDTWESLLMRGKDKRATFTQLLADGKIGYLAVLRNLRNMVQAEVDEQLVRDAILARKGARRVLPFRYVAAARAAPQFEPVIDEALRAAIEDMQALDGETRVLVDVSQSMEARLSAKRDEHGKIIRKSDLTRMDAAAILAAVIPGRTRVWTFSNRTLEVPARKGMAGVDAIMKSQEHMGTYMGAAVREVCGKRTNLSDFKRLIVISDEQSHDAVIVPQDVRSYMINVASDANGVGYPSSGWTAHVDGFSENVLRYIFELERWTDQPAALPAAE